MNDFSGQIAALRARYPELAAQMIETVQASLDSSPPGHLTIDLTRTSPTFSLVVDSGLPEVTDVAADAGLMTGP